MAQPFARSGSGEILLTQLPLAAGHGRGSPAADLPRGSRIVLVAAAEPPAGARILTREFVAAGHPALSDDARRFLFVGRKRAADALSIWERDIDGGNLRRVAGCEGDCTRAIYAATLYTIDSAAPVPQIVFSAARGAARSELFAMRADGTEIRRITFNPYGASDPLLLSDGRLVYAGGTGSGPGAGSALFTIHTDGTGIFPFTPAPGPGVRQAPAWEAPDGELYFVESNATSARDGGALVAVPRTRSLSERRVVAPAARGSFHARASHSGSDLLAAFRPEGEASYGIVRVVRREPERLEPVFDAPDWDDIDPLAVTPRPGAAGRSSSVREGVAHGTLYCLDARRSRASMGQDGAEIRFVNVFRAAEERESPTAGDGPGILLGQIPVEPDGSFQVRVPAATPLRLETVDAQGHASRAMHSWLWVMPNESRGCIGCHEERDLTPPNRMPLALRRPARELRPAAAAAGEKP